MSTRGIRRVPRRGAWHGRVRRAGIVALLMLVMVVAAACDSTNTYPIDFFSEMHYAESYHPQEPPRLDSPPSAVAYKGGVNVAGGLTADAAKVRAPVGGVELMRRLPAYTAEQAAELENPLPRNEATSQLGAQLFAVNCAVCHGPEGDGKSIAASLIFQANNQPVPADLRQRVLLSPIDDQPKELTDGELYYVITNGYRGMPAFGGLLSQEQIWALVTHIRELQGQ
ncbi:MAG: c-type cytochrome [Sphaerobacter sp.]|nr:c-type cytochrome [Sphaerobacter sp.]